MPSPLPHIDPLPTPATILRSFWGYEKFRPGQEEIIHSILKGNDTLALMPTGGGKSLCYQVPALIKPGICLVISPLIALMKDQVQALRRKNITAYAIFSGMGYREVLQTLKTVTNSNCKFLYVSPERLETALFREWLPAMDINLVAVDEAHCISQWGYDFRPSYLRIAALRDELRAVPLLALTASATRDVQADICAKLAAPHSSPVARAPMLSWKIFRQPLERPNLSYSVFQVDSKITKVIEILEKVGGTGIIYCKSRKRTKEISELLQLRGLVTDHYHAGLTQEDRNRKQEEWISDKIRVIVCTNAFGMGIDKADVRTVIHADLPDCLENYYQEAGRAGRDGKTAFAVLLFDEKDLQSLEELTKQRFPPIKELRAVYQAVVNYLQIPTGEPEGKYYDFDLADFAKKFKLKSSAALHALKALDQEGWLSLNEQVFLPATLQFTTSKDRLYEFEKAHPELEALIKTILRAYEGVFDQFTFISEPHLAKLLKTPILTIKANLTSLQGYGLIDYRPQKNNPQLCLLRNRAKAEDVTIDQPAYEQRKNRFTNRVAEMTRYTRDRITCRSQMIAHYLGDDRVKPCGICDNCLREKAGRLTDQEFKTIHERMIATIRQQALSAKDLLSQLGDIKKEKAWRVLEFLQAEQMILLDKDGLISVK